MSHFVCAISGNEPEVAVASPVSGEVFEKRLLIKYIEENGTDPITGQKLDISNLVELKQDPGIRSMQKSITSGGGSFLAFAKLVVDWKWILILLIILQLMLGVLATDSTASSNWDWEMLIPICAFFLLILIGLVVICGFIWAIVHVLVNSKFDVVLAKMEAMKSDQRAELHVEMNGIRGEMNGIRGEMNGIRGEMNGIREDMNDLRGEFKGLRVDLNWKLEIMKIELRGEIKGLSGEMNTMKSDLNGRINVLQAEMNGKK
ncbi:hypothetical protein niasHT_023593 [Heterodera trifolii]|uniref:Pre-mRNA-processing factor 19 n=1 Tax=Heterodera trifolii TaxID=157864 RepID=A0ABD2JK48_9BILA